jgi:D-threonate/D-erythronate kinase
MIAVIADDITGAAEMGGIGLRYNLLAEVTTMVPAGTDAELLVIATDTRSMSQEAAAMEMARLTKELLRLKPTLIFKKTDSVLRGHIIAEMTAQQNILGLKRGLLVAPNPALGRTIRDGVYYFRDQPVHTSSFSHDPEFPITSPLVYDMLQTDKETIQIKKVTDQLPQTGIIVGEVFNEQDLNQWATHIDANTFVAGAAGFFTAILDSLKIKGTAENIPPAEFASPLLLICGSAFEKSRQLVKNIEEAGGPVMYLPVINENSWYEVGTLLEEYGSAVIAIDAQQAADAALTAAELRDMTAALIKKVLKLSTIGELVIEGGSTAWAIFHKTGFADFYPVQELAPGVIRMKHDYPPLFVTVKPGSYDWPADMPFLKIKQTNL